MRSILNNSIILLNRNRKTLQNSIYYFGGSIIFLLISFFTQPIFARYLSAADFGILGYYNSVKGMFTPLFLFGMTQYYLMNYFRQNEHKNKKFLFNILAHLTIINIIISIVGFFVLKFGFSRFDINIPFLPFSIFLFLILFFNIYLSFVLINLRVRKNARLFLIISIIPPILNTGFGLLFVIQYDMGAAGKMLGQVVTNIIIGIISLILLRKYIIFHFNPSFFTKSLKFILPLIAAAYAYFPIRFIDKIYLERLDNISELGYYSIGFTAANFISLASMALYLAFEPDIYKYITNGMYKNVIKIGGLYFSIVVLFVVIFLLISPYLLDFLTSGRYTRAYKYTNIFAIGVIFMQIYDFLNNVIIAMKKTKITLLNNFIGAVSALFLYKILINKYFFIGAGYAFVLVAFILTLTSLLFIVYLKKKNPPQSENINLFSIDKYE